MFLVFEFGGSIEGGVSTPSKYEIATAAKSQPRDDSSHIFFVLLGKVRKGVCVPVLIR